VSALRWDEPVNQVVLLPRASTSTRPIAAPLPAPDPDEIVPTWLPPAPAWYRGRREQWQIAKRNLERAYLDVETTAAADAAVHDATPTPRIYVLCGQRYQEADTICPCWRCRSTSSQAHAYRDALTRLREVEIAVQQGGVG
jgi:hypothetical protein